LEPGFEFSFLLDKLVDFFTSSSHAQSIVGDGPGVQQTGRLSVYYFSVTTGKPTGKRSARKRACSVWSGGKAAKPHLSLPNKRLRDATEGHTVSLPRSLLLSQGSSNLAGVELHHGKIALHALGTPKRIDLAQRNTQILRETTQGCL
jgi:hypothetical protein